MFQLCTIVIYIVMEKLSNMRCNFLTNMRILQDVSCDFSHTDITLSSKFKNALPLGLGNQYSHFMY